MKWWNMYPQESLNYLSNISPVLEGEQSSVYSKMSAIWQAGKTTSHPICHMEIMKKRQNYTVDGQNQITVLDSH